MSKEKLEEETAALLSILSKEELNEVETATPAALIQMITLGVIMSIAPRTRPWSEESEADKRVVAFSIAADEEFNARWELINA